MYPVGCRVTMKQTVSPWSFFSSDTANTFLCMGVPSGSRVAFSHPSATERASSTVVSAAKIVRTGKTRHASRKIAPIATFKRWSRNKSPGLKRFKIPPLPRAARILLSHQ